MTRLAFAVSLILALAACQSSEDRAEGHYQSALALLAEGDLDRASVEFRNVFQLNGTHVEARRSFAQALRDDGQVPQSYSQFLRLAEQRPDDVEVRIVLAEMAMDSQNWQQVRLHGERVLTLVPEELRDDPRIDVIEITLAYADAIEANDNGARRDAADAARAALDNMSDNLPLRRILVDAAIRDQDAPGAMAQIDAALAIDPDGRELHNTRLALLAEMEDAEGLEAQLTDMIARFPEDQELVAALLRYFVARGQMEDAQAFLRAQIAAADGADGTDTNDLSMALVQFLLQTEGVEAALDEVALMIERSPESQSFRMIEASIRFASGETDAGIAQMEALIEGAEASGETNDAKIMLARMYVATVNPVGARRLVGEVLEADGAHVAAAQMEASWLIDDDRSDDAIALLRRALDEEPNNTTAMTLMARAHQRNGNADLARDFLALAFDASNSAPPEAIRYAANLAGDELYLAAEDTLITALRVQPGDLSLLEQLGRVYLSMEDWARATQVEDTVRRSGTDAGTRLADGLRTARLAASGQVGEAISFLQGLAETATDTDGIDPDAVQIAVVSAMLADGQIEEALIYSQEILADDPENVILLMARAAAETASGDLISAEASYRQITTLRPDFERAWTELIRNIYAQGDIAAAEAVLDEALAALPEGMNLLWAQASFLEQGGDIDGAISIYERLYEAAPDAVVIANNLASLITTYREDPESLERAYNIARRLRGSEVPQLQDTYGWIALRRGDVDEARPYLESAAAALTGDALVQFHYGMLLSAAGERDAAIAQLGLALEIAGDADTRPQFDIARAELERLEADAEDAGAGQGADQ